MDPAVRTLAGVAFGRFRVLPHRRELLADGQPIKLGGRAFDMLMTLIEARGGVVSKDTLMARVWPNRVVDEDNLHVQISALRAAFGAERDLIRTVSRRGYQFTGAIRQAPGPDERAGGDVVAAEGDAVLPSTNLPAPVSELIGREVELAEILDLAAAHRLVTLTGVGGIGKTRLALAAARRLLPQFADGVWLAEFSPINDPSLLPATVAAAAGLELAAGELSAKRLAQALADRRVLLVLDTCEHVVTAAAELAEAMLQAGSAARIIATGREPLRAEGEQAYPVPPLTVPATEGKSPWQYGAVQLFAQRWRESGARVSEDFDTGTTLTAICQRLDGIPLAIELAAARASILGIQQLAARLDDRFHLLTGSRRTALPRHQTLRATLDWSYNLLAEPERAILRRLAVFAGTFSLDGAMVVASSPDITPVEVVEGVASLVAKSLVVVELERVARYHLLDTTHGYALEKLVESGEREGVRLRHAEYYCHFFEQAEAEWATRPTYEWLADYRRQIDNLRTALDWVFSPDGDVSIGVALAAAAVPLWMHLSLLEECRARAAQALATLEEGASRDPRREMKLHAALSASLVYTKGPVGAEIGAACTSALKIAESVGDTEYQLRSLWGLWFFHTVNRHHRQAMALAQRSGTLAADRPDPNDRLIADRMIGVSQHYLGDQVSARRHLERVMADYRTSDHRSHIIRIQIDVRVAASAFLARALWLQGFPDQAVRVAESSVADALATGHTTSLCYALAVGACPIALFVGDLAAVEHYLSMLSDHATRHGLAHWRAFGVCFQGAVRIGRGDVVTGLRLIRAGIDEFGESRPALRFIICVIAEALGHAGQTADGLTAITEAIEQSEQSEECWLIAELLRVKGELLLMQEAPGAGAAAEDHFRQALDWARRQGVLSWELRAATSFARLMRKQGRSADAVALLQPIYDHFTEGFNTADLKATKELLDELQSYRNPQAD